MSKSAPFSSPEPHDGDALDDPAAPMLFTFRITKLLDIVRRSSAIANRRAFDISGIESRIMLHVGQHAPLSLNELADLIRLDRGQLSRAIKAMAHRGLIDSRRRPGGPAIVITLSAMGRIQHDRILALAAERNAFLLADIAPADIAHAARVLDAVTRKAEALLERERAEPASGDKGAPFPPG